MSKSCCYNVIENLSIFFILFFFNLYILSFLPKIVFFFFFSEQYRSQQMPCLFSFEYSFNWNIFVSKQQDISHLQPLLSLEKLLKICMKPRKKKQILYIYIYIYTHAYRDRRLILPLLLTIFRLFHECFSNNGAQIISLSYSIRYEWMREKQRQNIQRKKKKKTYKNVIFKIVVVLLFLSNIQLCTYTYIVMKFLSICLAYAVGKAKNE